MGVTYDPADEDVMAVVSAMMTEHHPELVEVDLRVSVLMATAEKDEAGQPKGPAVKLHGVACAAVVKSLPYKRRVVQPHDAEITIDADNWKGLTDDRRAALVDHELEHLLVARDKDGNIKSDDCGRPKLKMRMHDVDFGWFHSIAQRHGDASYEVKQAKAFADEHGQLYWGWTAPPAGGVESMPAALAPAGTKTGVPAVDKAIEHSAKVKAGITKEKAAKNQDNPSTGDACLTEVAAKFAEKLNQKKGGKLVAYFTEPATLDSLKLSPGAVAAACHADLLNRLQTGQTPDVRVLVIDGDDYVATPAPAGSGDDAYALRPLIEVPKHVFTDESKPYFGQIVKVGGAKRMIGGDVLLVRDAEAVEVVA